MSRVINKPVEELSEAEALYKFTRLEITEEQLRDLGYDPQRAVQFDKPLQFQPHTGDANTYGKTQKDLDKLQVSEEELEPQEDNLTEPQLEDEEEPDEGPTFDDDEDDDEDDEDDDDYTLMTNEKLRAEIQRRNDEEGKDLSLDGRKADLVATLEQDDAESE